MSKKRGLGKGLGALISNINEEELESVDSEQGATDLLYDSKEINESNEIFKNIPINKVIPNPSQARNDFNTEKLEELVVSIREHGVVQPIVVRPLENGNFEIIAGERRWRACKIIGMEEIPAIMKKYSEIEATAVSLIENIQREDLNSLEEANAYKRLMNLYALTQEDVSGMVGKSRSHISNVIRLLSLPEEIKIFLGNNSITTGHAKALLSLNDEELQMKVVEKIIANNLSVRETEKLIKDIISENIKKQRDNPDKEKVYIVMENNLNDYLKTMVNIKVNSQGNGKIEIVYKNKNELDRIISLISRV